MKIVVREIDALPSVARNDKLNWFASDKLGKVRAVAYSGAER